MAISMASLGLLRPEALAAAAAAALAAALLVCARRGACGLRAGPRICLKLHVRGRPLEEASRLLAGGLVEASRYARVTYNVGGSRATICLGPGDVLSALRALVSAVGRSRALELEPGPEGSVCALTAATVGALRDAVVRLCSGAEPPLVIDYRGYVARLCPKAFDASMVARARRPALTRKLVKRYGGGEVVILVEPGDREVLAALASAGRALIVVAGVSGSRALHGLPRCTQQLLGGLQQQTR